MNSPSRSSAAGTTSRDAPIRLAACKRRLSGAMMRRAVKAETKAVITPPATSGTTGALEMIPDTTKLVGATLRRFWLRRIHEMRPLPQ